MRGRQLMNALEGSQRRGHRLVNQVRIDRLRVDLWLRAVQFEDRVDGRCEQQVSGDMRVEQRFLPRPIASDVDLPRAFVPDGEGEHSIDALQKFFPTPGPVAVQQRFRIGLRKERIVRLQLLTQLQVIVDLAIEDQNRVAILADHGLMAGRREIDDGEPAEPECRVVVGVYPPVVRTTVDHQIRGAHDALRHLRRVRPDGSKNSTHTKVLPPGELRLAAQSVPRAFGTKESIAPLSGCVRSGARR